MSSDAGTIDAIPTDSAASPSPSATADSNRPSRAMCHNWTDADQVRVPEHPAQQGDFLGKQPPPAVSTPGRVPAAPCGGPCGGEPGRGGRGGSTHVPQRGIQISRVVTYPLKRDRRLISRLTGPPQGVIRRQNALINHLLIRAAHLIERLSGLTGADVNVFPVATLFFQSSSSRAIAASRSSAAFSASRNPAVFGAPPAAAAAAAGIPDVSTLTWIVFSSGRSSMAACSASTAARAASTESLKAIRGGNGQFHPGHVRLGFGDKFLGNRIEFHGESPPAVTASTGQRGNGTSGPPSASVTHPRRSSRTAGRM